MPGFERGRGSCAASVLLVGRDLGPRARLAQMFEGEGYAIVEADTAADADLVFDEQPVDLVVLDGRPSEASVLSFCRKAAGSANTSVLVMAEDPDLTDEIVILETGADGLLAKTADRRLLLARSRALLRRTEQFARSVAAPQGVWRIDHRLRLAVSPSGTQIPLTQLMVDLMALFIENPGVVITPESAATLLRQPSLEADNLRTPIARLRRRLEAAGEGGAIRTLYGRGYVFESAAEDPQETAPASDAA